ncbi:MAG: hypothetical protein IT410_01320 [Candidatus Doudnabacteria bacterium]|nr:hypothetical protein [Candidatus Doudnabacteria bacterium]
MSVFKEVLDWSLKQPLWQRDALRRIVSNTKLTEEDVDEILEICKYENGIGYEANDAPKIVGIPLDAEHLPSSASNTEAVIINSISQVDNVNALASNQTLKFSPQGLTVVSGDNGSGKTGYARILKSACRTRGSQEPVQQNIFNAKKTTPPSARIDYTVGSISKYVSWVDGTNSPEELSSVSVLDSNSASVHVKERNDVAFLPSGMDVLSKLASACAEIKSKLALELELMPSQQFAEFAVYKGTNAEALITNMSDSKSTKQLEKIAVFGDVEEKELRRLTESKLNIIAQDPATKAKSINSQNNRFKSLSSRLARIEPVLTESSIAKLSELHKDFHDKNTAALTSSASQFEKEELKGVGGESWKLMWEAARQYSVEHAYPEKLFPVTEPSSKCVLCHQDINLETKTKLERFEQYVADKLHTDAHNAKGELLNAQKAIISLMIVSEDDSNVLSELESYSPWLAKSVKNYLETAKSIQTALNSALTKSKTWPESAILSLSPNENLLDLIKDITESVEILLAPSEKIDTATLDSSIKELEAKKLLVNRKADVIAEIQKLAIAKHYNKAITETATTAITLKNKTIVETIVTQTLKDTFKDELAKVGIDNVIIELQSVEGKRAVQLFQIQIKAQDMAVPVQKIFSEGEHRAIALAAFMTDLATSSAKSAIIFDDPVSSLDHKRKCNIAKRLVAESKDRQVIVFTHDLSFILLLMEESDLQGTTQPFHQNVARNQTSTGFCSDDLPWDGMKVTNRISKIREELKEIENVYSTTPNKYEVRSIYAHLRETWERLIEEIIFADVVQRMGRTVQTTRLYQVINLDESHRKTVHENMTKVSQWSGHDQAAMIGTPPPSPSEIKTDIDVLETFANELKAIQKTQKRPVKTTR